MAWNEYYKAGPPLWKLYRDFYKLKISLTSDKRLAVETLDGKPLGDNPGITWLMDNKEHAVDRLRHEGGYPEKDGGG